MTQTQSSGGLSTAIGEDGERRAYIALAQAPGIGAKHLAGLLSRYGSASAVLEASQRARGAERRDLMLARAASIDQAHHLADECANAGISMLIPGDGAFPAQLRSIPQPPLLIFARGRLELAAFPAAAIVGSRDHTAYGRDVAKVVAGGAAAAGVAVVSGMARGLDAIAHHAALDQPGPTIGVLGNGIGVVYPAANRELYARVEAGGLLLSEHPPGERPTAGSFPRRNRLISGLASVVVVIEAARGSGTLVTVSAALEQGRDVMAVPGPITSSTSAGTNQLLRDGAEPLLELGDLLAKFSLAAPADEAHGAMSPLPTLSENEAQVFHALTAEARQLDDVASTVGLPIGVLLGVLCGLELGGLVEQLPGSLFRRIR